jgi:suppressor for copper-sensitivity B
VVTLTGGSRIGDRPSRNSTPGINVRANSMNIEIRQIVKRSTALVFSLVLLVIACGPATAQGDAGQLDVFPSISLGDFGSKQSEPAVVRASYSVSETAAGAAAEGILSVTAQMQDQWHVYSITQAAGGPTPTKITLTGPAGVKLLGEFKPDVAAKISTNPAWPGLRIEEHYDQVTWSAPISLPAGFDGEIAVTVSALVCKTDGSCIPLNSKLQAKPVGRSDSPSPSVPVTAADSGLAAAAAAGKTAPPETAVSSFRDSDSVVQWTGQLSQAKVSPGSRVVLRLTAAPDASYHVYAGAVDAAESRTNFVITETAGLKFGKPQPSTEPIFKAPVEYHEGTVTWSIPIEIGPDVSPGTKQIAGSIGYQACTETSCLLPQALSFTAEIEVTPQPSGASAATAVRFATAPRAATMDAVALTDWVDPTVAPLDRSETATQDALPAAARGTADRGDGPRAAVPLSLVVILAMAMVGGLILNLMPCVLPVVGLKIMSFASQAGKDRGKVLALNGAYTLGILVVFWALAALAILSTYSWGREFLGIEGQLSWGQQFQFFAFRYGVILLVFALALSFLNVWEIPIPGFVGGKSTQQLQRQEGFSGAFFKGIFTTLLATPCSGPLLGTVFAYTLGKSAWVIFAIFSSIGLGMAMPYLLIAAFPRLIVYLPKPGAWMDTFKQLLGFLLLATVAFIFSFFPQEDLVFVFGSLIGVWFGCWIIGSVPNWETLPKRLAAWGGGIGAAAAACLLAFWMTAAGPAVLAWEPYNEARLQQLQREGRTVLVDFTAKWCVNCIVNYNIAINTQQTGRLVRELGAVPMLADWTDHDEAIGAKLKELDSNSIPVLAIFPGSDPQNPIVLRDLVTQGEVLTALRQAGPSVTVPPTSLVKFAGDDLNR